MLTALGYIDNSSYTAYLRSGKLLEISVVLEPVLVAFGALNSLSLTIEKIIYGYYTELVHPDFLMRMNWKFLYNSVYLQMFTDRFIIIPIKSSL